MTNKVYIIGIGGIGISAIARYYNHIGYEVYGSDKVNSELIETLQKEGIKIIIGEDKDKIDNSFNLVVYTEAVPEKQKELTKAREIGIETLTYPQALAFISNSKKLIAVAGTHGKSTTSSLVGISLKNSSLGVNAVIGTILKEFGNKNAYFSNSDYFVIEACEYKRSFLRYKPYIGVITNIEIDHLDYYKDLDDYISAFSDYLDNIIPGGYAILNGEDKNCKKLLDLRNDINYIEIFEKYFILKGEKILFPKINMQVPGEHILFDAQIAYITNLIVGNDKNTIINSLEAYKGVWRRMEILGNTENGNLLISDYGHHPTEIKLTLKSIKDKYKDKKILTIFQPHQYNRTIELLDGFKNSFINTDILIIPNIYESRDSDEDIEKMNTEILLKNIEHNSKYNGNGLDNTSKIIEKYDGETPDGLVIILMGAGDVDNLRYKIKTYVR